MKQSEIVSLDHRSNFMDDISYSKITSSDYLFGNGETEMPEFVDGHVVPAVDDIHNDWCAS